VESKIGRGSLTMPSLRH